MLRGHDDSRNYEHELHEGKRAKMMISHGQKRWTRYPNSRNDMMQVNDIDGFEHARDLHLCMLTVPNANAYTTDTSQACSSAHIPSITSTSSP